MRWLPLLVCLALASATAVAALVRAEEGSGAEARVLATAGDLELTDSREGSPIFSASGIGPGDSASGTVEIGATGSRAADLVLSADDLLGATGATGATGVELSRALMLRVTDLSAGGELVYSGPLATMPPQPLGRLEPGDSRTYEFVATLPEGGPASDQNDVQGTAMSVAYIWSASEAVDPPPSGGDPTERRPAIESPPSGPHLAVTSIWRRPEHGLILAHAACDRPCTIAVHGGLRAWGRAGARSASIPLSSQPRLVAGRQRLVVEIPAELRAWLRANPTGVWARARLVFRARDEAGRLVEVKRAPWLRHPRWAGQLVATR